MLFLGGTFKAAATLWGVVALGWPSRRGAGGRPRASRRTVRPTRSASARSQPATRVGYVYAAPVLFDQLALFFKSSPWSAASCWCCSAGTRCRRRHAAEYHGCLLLIVAGVCLTGSANDLITLFLALELISIPTYVLLYLPRTTTAAQEAAMKYFLLSIFSSALLLFGFSYLYGLTGHDQPAGHRSTRFAGRAVAARPASAGAGRCWSAW